MSFAKKLHFATSKQQINAQKSKLFAIATEALWINWFEKKHKEKSNIVIV